MGPPRGIDMTTHRIMCFYVCMYGREIANGSTMKDRSDDPSNHVFMYVCMDEKKPMGPP